ncbi:MAG TPA: TraR/DksA C4-type zinc finger protein [Patescibacteria group bacterium]|nr:TraR/DksA C4-type zinc finger protein [Patescibacteria group bacterium]
MEKSQYYSAEFLKEMKQVLLSRKDKIKQQLANFAQKDPNQEENYNSNFPDFGEKEDENAAEVADFEKNLSLEGNLEQSLEMINRALSKIEDGTYGICEKTGEPIGEERLRVMPTATKKVFNKKKE